MTDDDLESFRPSPEVAAKLVAAGEDPYPGQRLNYLAGTSTPFEPLLEELTPNEREVFAEFEKVMPGLIHGCHELDRSAPYYQDPDRFTMLVFLQADTYNLKRATARLLETLVWRQKSGFEQFVTEPDATAWGLYYRLRPRRILGCDKGGRAFTVEPTGSFFGSDNGARGLPMRSWVLCYAFDISLTLAALRTYSVRHGRALHRLAYVGDLAGLRARQAKAVMPLLKTLTRSVERYFPELAGKVMLYNSPSVFPVLFRVVKLFLDKRTAEKISVHSGVPSDLLVETFGAEVVPLELGGKLPYPFPRVRPFEDVLAEVGLSGPLPGGE